MKWQKQPFKVLETLYQNWGIIQLMDYHISWHQTRVDIIEKAHPKIMHVLISTSSQNDDLLKKMQNLRGIFLLSHLPVCNSQSEASTAWPWRQCLQHPPNKAISARGLLP